ncbi:MAG: sensor domain-containing protein [Acidimicrobiales bacterium]
MIRATLAPWRTARTWREVCEVATDLPAGVVTFTVVITLLSTSLGLLIVLPLAVPVLWATFVTARALGSMERSRLAALLDLDLPDPHPSLQGTNWFSRLLERVKSPSRWKEIGYLLALLPLGIVTFTVSVAVAACGLALTFLPFYVAALREGSANFGLFRVGPGLPAVAAALWVCCSSSWPRGSSA